MAKKSQIHRDLKRDRMIANQRAKRQELKKVISHPDTSYEDKEAAVIKLQKMPRNGSSVRKTTRCFITGRSHAVYKKFLLSRIKFRELAHQGKLPGVTKASW